MTTYKLKANGKYSIESGSDDYQPFDSNSGKALNLIIAPLLGR